MAVTAPPLEPTEPAVTRRVPNYLNISYTAKSWLLTTDHKRIGVLYLLTITALFLLGGAAAVVIRLELLTPRGDVVTADMYNQLFTMHGVIMVWFFLIPSIPATLGNFLVPLMIGADDMVFPRLNLASWYVFLLGIIIALASLIAGGIDTGWTFYTPYSTTYARGYVALMLVGIFVTGFSTIFTAMNIIVTVHKLRAPGMTWFRLPLFIWSQYATSLIILLATPVLAILIILVAVERIFRVGIFDPALGGDPILFQHLFWFYSHPAVYIMILPAQGVISEIIPCFSRKPPFGYVFIALSSIAIALFGFLVWGHHMFTSGQSIYAGMIFSILSFAVAIPSAIKVFNWTATLYKGQITLRTPMLYALGFIGLFVIGGLTGLFLATLAVDVHLHDTYFVVAHFHYIMVGGTVMAYLGAIHFWWPKITGRMYPSGWGVAAAILIFAGFNLTFFPQFILGTLGMPRRYWDYAPEFQVLNVMSTAGASIQAIGYLLPLLYLSWSLYAGKKAPPNPWGATGLEWSVSSPPPVHNFAETPVVTRDPYQYDHIEPTHIEKQATTTVEPLQQQLEETKRG